ncbi:MAG TPA: bifunctional diaminohydroxyphosphoribosylaminopyrimidine deaminase/5-amino-6-(5-phosphoribosylamino)uracil reductase RibD [Terriglobia bacterium]|nr:bifunctional diaminohydroxyphosphoribosylaminopyrimidine deaminase/5-amino-6-(5-phosphoribosylamino)uracil reductase RibD [Terriglobia bacterium]
MTDEAGILRAIELAQQGVGLVSPGALVGAVIVNHGRTVGEGFYTWDGRDHAEVIALRQAGTAARGSTVYTSLEPCSHTGRTPPCAQALIDAGVARVVTAMKDPNPNVNGMGLEMLKRAGIEVICGVHEREARAMNEAFIAYKTENRAFGVLKFAMTLDGKIATRTGESKWITSPGSRAMAQSLRHSVDAVVTGSGTFLKDQPQMTDRTGLKRRRELLRVVMDRRGQITNAPGWLVLRGSLEELSRELKNREIQSFLLECGPDLAFNALQAGIMDKIVAFVAPRLLGGREVPVIGGAGFDRLADAIQLENCTIANAGDDFVITSYVHRNH